MRFLRSKFLLYATAFIFLLFMTSDFGLVNIERTAIIMALGVDYLKEENEFEVTAQLAIPQPSSNASSENKDSLISEKGKTIADAIDKIGIMTGWYPMLSFCNLILIGSDMLSLNVMKSLNYFIKTDKFEDSAHIACAEGTAKDILSSSTPLDSISSFTIQKILGKDIAKLDRIADVSIKDFALSFYTKSQCGYMPLLKKIKITGSSDDGATQTSKTQSGLEGGVVLTNTGGSNGSSDKQGKDQYVFDASSTILFDKGNFVATLTPEETLFFNLEHKNSFDTFLSLEDVEIDGKKFDVMLGVNEHYKNYKLKFIDGVPTFVVDIVFFCKYEDANTQYDVSELIPTSPLPEEVLISAEKKINETLTSLFEKLQTSNCDLFQFKNALYKFHYSHYEEFKDNILSKTVLKANVDCQSEKSTRL